MEPAIRAASTAAIKTAAVATRTSMLERRAAATAGWLASPSAASIGNLLRPRSKAPHPALVGGERLVEVGFAEIRPERLGAVKLGVGRLPQEEIAQPHLAGSPDHQVGVGQATGVEMRRQARLIELGQIGALARQLADGVHDLEPTAVIDRDIQDGPRRDAGPLTGLSHLIPQRGR